MSIDRNYILKKIAKSGIALGLVLTLATGCTQTKIDNIENTQPTESTPSEYINTTTSDEFRTYDEDRNTITIALSEYNYLDFITYLNNADYNFEMAKYYELEEALTLYKNTTVNKHTTSNLLDENNKLDPNKLLEKILENNKAYMSANTNTINIFYEDIDKNELAELCNLIAEVVNSEFNDIDIAKVANTLTQLKMFIRNGSASVAYITDDLTFVYNPNMASIYSHANEITNKIAPEKTLKSIMVHEIMHLLEYSSSDINDNNGIEAGICRMYNVPNEQKKLEVDSLWNSWLLEASAELGMATYLDTKPDSYAKKISYVKSYNLSRFNELTSTDQALENVAFNSDLETAFEDLKINNEEEQSEFLYFLYSIEITQENTPDFWENYTKNTGLSPSEEEKLAIKMNIRTDAVKYLSKQFYSNLMTAIYEQKITDLDTTFYFMRLWELDTFNHLEYTKITPLKHAKDFIKWQSEIHSQIFQAIADSNELTKADVEKMYDEYNLQAIVNDTIYTNCNLNNFNTYTSTYITSAPENYSTINYSRNKAVMEYIINSNTAENTTNTTK